MEPADVDDVMDVMELQAAGQGSQLPNGALSEDALFHYNQRWSLHDPNFTVTQGIQQAAAILDEMWVRLARIAAPTQHDISQKVCVAEAYVKLAPSTLGRDRLIGAYEDYDPNGTNPRLTARIVSLYRESIQNHSSRACIKLAKMYLRGNRVAKDVELGLQVFRMGWGSVNRFVKELTGLEYVKVLLKMEKFAEADSILEWINEHGTFNQSVRAKLALFHRLCERVPSSARDRQRAREMVMETGVFLRDQDDEDNLVYCDWVGDIWFLCGKAEEDGIGGPRNLLAALDWYVLASQNGNPKGTNTAVRRVSDALGVEFPPGVDGSVSSREGSDYDL